MNSLYSYTNYLYILESFPLYILLKKIIILELDFFLLLENADQGSLLFAGSYYAVNGHTY